MKEELTHCPDCGSPVVLCRNNEWCYYVYCERCAYKTHAYKEEQQAIDNHNDACMYEDSQFFMDVFRVFAGNIEYSANYEGRKF